MGFSSLVLGTMMALFSLNSPGFQDQSVIPKQYTCEGADLSPELKWQDAPTGTKSFALTVTDPNAAEGLFTHWIVYNIPATVNALPPSCSKDLFLDSGILQGMNDFKEIGYKGPCPPQTKRHSYIFTLYALDTVISMPPGRSYLELNNEMRGHILAETQLTGYFSH